MENIALTYISASLVGVIVAAAPLFTALIAAVVLQEKLSKWFFFGFVCAMAGVALVSLAGVSELHFSPIGALLGVGAALVWGVYSVLVRSLVTWATVPFRLPAAIFGYGLLFLLVPAVIEGFPSGLSVWTQPVHLANLLFLGLCASATCFVTWNRAVFLLGPVKTSVYIYGNAGYYNSKLGVDSARNHDADYVAGHGVGARRSDFVRTSGERENDGVSRRFLFAAKFFEKNEKSI